MHFAVRCTFRPGGAEERFRVRIAHIEYMTAALPITLIGGARLIDGAASATSGMLVIVDVPDREAAERFITHEPYNEAGLFAVVELEQLKVMTADVLRSELAMEKRKALGP